MNTSVARSTFTTLSNHHLCLVPEHFYLPKRRPILLSSYSPAPGNHQFAFCLSGFICLVWTFHIKWGHTARPVHLSTTYHCLCAVTVGSYDRDHLACKARKYLLSRIFIFRKEFAGPWVDTSSRPAASLLVRKQTWGLVPSWRVLQYHGMTSWLTAIFKKKLGSK